MERITNPESGRHRRAGENYQLTPEEIQQYKDQGYLTLHDVLTEEELEPLEYWFDHFVAGKEMRQMGRDFCDMSQPYGTPVEEFQLVNAMLPGKYRSELANNLYHRIAQNITNQLYTTGEASMDYEQFLAKKPTKKGAEFAMHQDLGYWPKTDKTWTATFSLALSNSDLVNGCLQVIPGTNNEPELRKHMPKAYAGSADDGKINRNDSHTLVIEENKNDKIVYLPVKKGSITIHDERIIHGSGGNHSEVWRKTYVMAFRDVDTIREERAMGFTHSHNDKVDWDKIVK
ncbi:MAG: phytanoyl-CoA dioxygenase family protein [Bacteroidota bacterium]